MAMTRDVPSLVLGYQRLLSIFAELGDLSLILVYQCMVPFVFNKPFSFVGFVPLVACPVAMIIYLKIRQELSEDIIATRNAAQDAVVNCVDQTIESYQIINDFAKKTEFTDRFEASVKKFNSKHREMGVVLMHNHYFARCLCAIVGAAWIVVGGASVLQGQLTLGMFITNLSIFGKCGTAAGNIYRVILDIIGIFPALEVIVKVMNLPVDLEMRMKVSRGMQAKTASWAQRCTTAGWTDGGAIVANMPILFEHLKFQYCTVSPAGCLRHKTLDLEGMFAINQGQLVCLLGPCRSGKSTMLKLMAGGILPSDMITVQTTAEDREATPATDIPGTQREFFIPCHLRLLHASYPPIFFDGTLLENLAVGMPKSEENEQMLYQVCEHLGLGEDVLDHIKKKDKQNWQEVFSFSEIQGLYLARAVVASADVLVLHRAVTGFDDVQVRVVMDLLHQYVEGTGCCASLFGSNSLRTCIFSTANRLCIRYSDIVYYMCKEKGIRKIDQLTGLSMCS
jgi:ABC-type bacteriocin/lantibiotic exporter with double-glycine peptidase domain